MDKITLIVLCAGDSTRFMSHTKKQWLRIGDKPLWLYVTNRLNMCEYFTHIIITANQKELKYMQNFSNEYSFVTGGATRQQSIKNALELVDTKYVMITDVARCCVPLDVIQNLIQHKQKASCIVPILDVTDTVIYQNNTINRKETKLIQTPQLSQTNILKKALDTKIEFTDESSAIKHINKSVFYISGSTKSKKLTFQNELDELQCLKPPSNDNFIGYGIDIHQFEENKIMKLGGVTIDVPYGFKAHSDGDVLIHSLIDALLGAASAGDIGEFFPDNDPQYKNIDSTKLLSYIVDFIAKVGYEIINIDLTIVAEQPKLSKYKQQIKQNLSKILNIPIYKINIKATTSEKMGFIGKKEGVAVLSVANMKYYNWMKK